MSRSLSRPALLCIALAAAGCGERKETTTTPSPIPMSIATGANSAALYAPLYIASANGDFAKAALTVTVEPAASDAAALARVASGAADAAVASEPQLLEARQTGQPLIAIGALVQTPLEAIISPGSHPITSAPQLQGRAVALPDQPLNRAELKTILRAAGIAESTVHQLRTNSGVARALIAHKADAALGFDDYDAVLLDLHHLRPHSIPVDSAGVPTYSQLVLVVRQADVRRNGPKLRALLQALSRSAAAARTDPAAAANELTTARPNLSRRVSAAVLRATVPSYFPADSTKPFGYQDPRAWGTFGSWMLTSGLLTRPADATNAVTDEFLPGQGE